MKFEDKSVAPSIKERLLSMQGKVEALKSIEVDINFNQSERAFDLALISTHENKEKLSEYANDPYHLEIVAYLKSINTLTKVVDSEI
jgi:hypothetical protein